MSQTSQSEVGTKICPKCKEQILQNATVCKHCGANLKSWVSRHKILTALIILFIGMPIAVSISGTVFQSYEKTKPAPVLTPEQEAKLKAEKEAFDKTPAGKLCLKHTAWTKEECENVANNKIWVGMTLEMLEIQSGKPDSSNLSNYGSGFRHQYCWHDLNPSCYYDNNDDGVIDSFN